MDRHLLIISNNPLSEVQSNGKTVLSMIENIDCNCVRQLYFNSNDPTIKGYRYFRISDRDVIRGLFRSDRRGTEVEPKNGDSTIVETPIAVRTDFFRFLREILWYKRWKSEGLAEWLKEFNPDAVFLVGGDCVFAYDIALEIKKEYKSRLTLYITDDYILSSYFSEEKVEHDNDGIPRIFWMGNYIPLHGIKKAIEACGLLNKRGYKFHLTLWGNQTVDISPYKQLVHELGIDDCVTFRSDWKGQEYYHKEIRNQDIVLGIFGDSEKAKTVIVNKVLDAVCEKTTVLTAPSKGLLQYFDGENDIWYCDNNPEAIADRMIDIIKSNHEIITNRTKNAYEVYEKNFSVSAFDRTVAKMIKEIKTEKGIN